ncbi:MAG: HEAT repeat domain-containing protein [Planctomycetaceae bacterium]|nr:HEAT repeat domain-containing protein [Planctomycetaceae bacterium]
MAILYFGVLFAPRFAEAQVKYDPDHPEVRRMVNAGVAYLRTDSGSSFGENVLVGLAVLNSYTDNGFKQDPLVNKAVQQALAEVPRLGALLDNGFTGHDVTNGTIEDKVVQRMYEVCVALMLLVEYDDKAYDREIRTLINYIVKRQDPRGGWTYNKGVNSDSSQTQYCCLALWLAHHKGFDIPLDHSVRATRFWVSHQFNDGSWAYQPVATLLQGSPHVSLVSAGAGSLYMLGDILGVNPPPKRLASKKPGETFLDLPAFVERLTEREVADLLAKQENVKEEAPAPQVDVQGLNGAKQRANQWFARSFRTETDHWPYYALYGFERYATFREKVDGEVTEVPDWYDQGVEFVKANQKGDGSLTGTGEGGPAVHTSLAILFLVRSTQRLTNLPKDTVMNAGFGLGGRTNIRGNQVINEEEKKDIAELLNRVKADMSPEELAEIAESFRNAAVTSIKDKSRSQQLLMLKEMVKNEHWQIRIVAVRALGQVRMIDNCPALIFALTDPNPNVVQEANIALQFVSRKTETPPVPVAKSVNGDLDTSSDEYKQGIRRLYEYWSEWYLELKPDAQLFPVDLDNLPGG